VLIDNKLECLIEVKLTDDGISPNLKYYKDKLKPKHAIQLVGNLKTSYEKNEILVTNPIEFFTEIILPPWKVGMI
jgi:hypothetical protein